MEFVPIKNSIYRDVRLTEVISKVVERLNELHLIERKYVGDGEFILFLMNLVENIVEKKDKIDKKKLVLDIFRNHFSASPAEIELIDKMIEFLHTNNKIKKVSYYRMFKAGLAEWFLKKPKS